MTYEERLRKLIDEAGHIVYFHTILEQAKQSLEEPVDTPDEVWSRLWMVETYEMMVVLRREAYERVRDTFSPKDRIVEALDNLIKECGAER